MGNYELDIDFLTFPVSIVNRRYKWLSWFFIFIALCATGLLLYLINAGLSIDSWKGKLTSILLVAGALITFLLGQCFYNIYRSIVLNKTFVEVEIRNVFTKEGFKERVGYYEGLFIKSIARYTSLDLNSRVLTYVVEMRHSDPMKTIIIKKSDRYSEAKKIWETGSMMLGLRGKDETES